MRTRRSKGSSKGRPVVCCISTLVLVFVTVVLTNNLRIIVKPQPVQGLESADTQLVRGNLPVFDKESFASGRDDEDELWGKGEGHANHAKHTFGEGTGGSRKKKHPKKKEIVEKWREHELEKGVLLMGGDEDGIADTTLQQEAANAVSDDDDWMHKVKAREKESQDRRSDLQHEAVDDRRQIGKHKEQGGANRGAEIKRGVSKRGGKEAMKKGTESATKKGRYEVCPGGYRNASSELLKEPPISPRFAHFNLSYITPLEDSNDADEENRFGGHQTLEQREESFELKDSMNIHCGFLGGPAGVPGFKISKGDQEALATCHIAVVSALFGDYDTVHSPAKSVVSDAAKRRVCFVLFLDSRSLEGVKRDRKYTMGKDGRIGLWTPVLVEEPLSYDDARRTGKIPKLLAHRLFPNARFSIWVDAKLRLVQDPLAVLEKFLWRNNFEYAISNHYDRHTLAEEVDRNKKLNKYDHSAIDEQYQAYLADDIDDFDPEDPSMLLPSYVPEGSFIVREHTPMSNLFSCLWFNEVDRFTSRDQLSFAYTFLKLARNSPKKKLRLNMFRDCERRATVKLFHHRVDEVALKHRTKS